MSKPLIDINKEAVYELIRQRVIEEATKQTLNAMEIYIKELEADK